jgi:hypothetical protein
MSDFDDEMLERMIHIVYDEHRPFCYREFLDLMKPKMYRNKISKLKKDGIVELDTKSSIAFYTLKGNSFGKAGTPYHTGITISHNDPTYNMIKNLPMDKQCIHDIHLKFKASEIYRIFSDNTPYPKTKRNLAIAIPPWNNNHAIVRITINKNDTVTVIIGCSIEPIPLDYNGIIRIFTILARAEGFLNGMTSMVNNYKLDQPIPQYGRWIITRWDFGRDSLQTYNGKNYEITVEKAGHAFMRIYTKDYGRLRKIRLESVECPPMSVTDAIQEKLNIQNL